MMNKKGFTILLPFIIGTIIAVGVLGYGIFKQSDNKLKQVNLGGTFCMPYQGCLGTSTAPTAGQLLRGKSTGVYELLATSTDGAVLSLDTNGYPAWAATSSLGIPGFANPMTSPGDIIYGGAAGVATRLASSSDYSILNLDANGYPAWTQTIGTEANPLTAGYFTTMNASTSKITTLTIDLISPGQLLVATSTAPDYSYQYDTNTGLGWISDDKQALYTGGTARLTVDSSGNVGIGTTSPGSLLSLNNIANFTTATSTFYGNGINLEDGCFAINGTCVGGGGSGSGTVNTGVAGYLAFYPSTGTTVDDTDALYFDDTNNRLGIGTTSPYAKLSVVGEVVGSYFTATSTTATSTLPYLTSTRTAITGLVSCDTIDTDADGYLKCGSDSTGTGGAGTVSTSTTPIIGNLAYWTGTGWPSTLGTVATTTLTGTAPIVFSNPINVLGGSASAISCSAASGSVAGCLASADWTSFNNKIASTSIDTIAELNTLLGGEDVASTTWAGATSLITLGTITTGTWSADTITVSKGGTGLTSIASGGLLFAAPASTLNVLASSTPGYYLRMNATTGRPEWGIIDTIASSTNPTISATQDIGINTTAASSSIRYWDGAEKALYPESEKTITIASSTQNSFAGTAATSTIGLGRALRDETWTSIICFTNTGTTTIQITDGTNKMDTIQCGSGGLINKDDGSIANNTFTLYEKRYLDIKTIAGTPAYTTITAFIRKDAD